MSTNSWLAPTFPRNCCSREVPGASCARATPTNTWSASPATALSPSVMSTIPRRNRPTPPRIVAITARYLTWPQGFRYSCAPGPSGSPSAIHATSNTVQQSRKTSVYGSIVATTVPMPALRS